MSSGIAIVISILALGVSLFTAWFTWFRRGKLKMTQPTVIFFGPDVSRPSGREKRPKVYLRTLLYSTSQRGQTLESIYVNLQRGETRQNFSIWVYGERRLARGSGLFIPVDGVVCNHHFLLPEDGTTFDFSEGEYVLRVFAKTVHDSTPNLLSTIQLRITKGQAEELWSDSAGIYFDWGPDQQAYQAHIDKQAEEELTAEQLAEIARKL